jgi:hypothetical protein
MEGILIVLLSMSDYHNTHWVTFYKQSVFSAPVSVAVNCFTFDALSHLSDDDANLFFSALVVVSCAVPLSIIKQCPVKGHHILFCKRLDDPHHKCFFAEEVVHHFDASC